MVRVGARYRRGVAVLSIALLGILVATPDAAAQSQVVPITLGGGADELFRTPGGQTLEAVVAPGGGGFGPVGNLQMAGGGSSSSAGPRAGESTTTGSAPPATTTDPDEAPHAVRPARVGDATHVQSPLVDGIRDRMARVPSHLLGVHPDVSDRPGGMLGMAGEQLGPLAAAAAGPGHPAAEDAPADNTAPAPGIVLPALEREQALPQEKTQEEERWGAVRSIEMEAPPAPDGNGPAGPAWSPTGGDPSALLPSDEERPSYLPGAATAVAAAVLWHLVSFFAPLLTARRKDPLSHEARRRLSDAVRKRPGAHLRQLAHMAELAMGQTTHHLKVLVASGAVVRVRLGGFVCFFPDSQSAAALASGAAVLRSARARQFLCHVDAHPGCIVADAEVVLGVPRGGLKYHAARLVEAGLLETTPQGRERALDVTAAGRAAAEPLHGQARGKTRAADMHRHDAACAAP